MADTCGTPIPAMIRVVQIEPGPIPILTPSTPASIRSLAPLAVPTLPAIKSESENNNYLAWYTRSFEFENQTLEEICLKLSEVYRIQINIKNNELKKQRLTTSFEQQSIDEIMDVIQTTINCEIYITPSFIQIN